MQMLIRFPPLHKIFKLITARYSLEEIQKINLQLKLWCLTLAANSLSDPLLWPSFLCSHTAWLDLEVEGRQRLGASRWYATENRSTGMVWCEWVTLTLGWPLASVLVSMWLYSLVFSRALNCPPSSTLHSDELSPRNLQHISMSPITFSFLYYLTVTFPHLIFGLIVKLACTERLLFWFGFSCKTSHKHWDLRSSVCYTLEEQHMTSVFRFVYGLL